MIAATETTYERSLAGDVLRGLCAKPRSIPPKWFYDPTGSALFDRICELPEYYLTRAERGILERDADAIAAHADASELFELGSGMARKTGLLLAAMARRHPRPRYVPFDIAPEALEACGRSIREVVDVDFDPVVGDFEHDLAGVRLRPEQRRMFAFLGSTIGNLDERAAPAMVASVARKMRRRDSFLLGVDLIKDVSVLEAAYDDREGVTAAFNKNVLTVLNRELGADFDLELFTHVARFDEPRARIEMHLESRVDQRIYLRKLDRVVDLARGERILTEISRKFTQDSTTSLLRAGGMQLESWHLADDGSFALAVAERTV